MFRLAPLWIAANAIGDETSLMQGVKPQQIAAKDDKSKSVSSLLETAKSMLNNGATPDVTTFALATLEAITNGEDGVLSKIVDAHDADQLLVQQTYRMFADAFEELEAGVVHIASLHEREVEHNNAHRTCRGMASDDPHIEDCAEVCTTEHCVCECKRDCDYELWKSWKHFAWEESDLRFKSTEIEDHFCVEGANGTGWIFRDYSVSKFPRWIEQKGVVDQWALSYGEWREECVSRYETMESKTAECDGHQLHLEQASCTLANRQREVKNAFARFWVYATRTYQGVMDDVHCLEIDRWKEWRSLKTVECLLGRTRERNGRPCEESTDEFEAEVAACEQVQVDTDITHLIIDYPHIPDYPPDCVTPAAGHEDYPRCVPDPVPVPCEEDLDLPAGQTPPYNPAWTGEFFVGLWTPPTSDFHAPTYRVDSHVEPVTHVQHHHRCPEGEGQWRITPQAGVCQDLTLRESESHQTYALCTCPGYDESTDHWDGLQTLRDTGNSHCNPRPPCEPCTLEPLAYECEVISQHERHSRNRGRRGDRWVRYPLPEHECRAPEHLGDDATQRQIAENYDAIRTDGYLSNDDVSTDQETWDDGEWVEGQQD